MHDSIAIVTDSTSSLPADLVERYDVRVVPLQVVVDVDCLTEGVDLEASDVAAALEAHQAVSTSRPAPEVFARVYAELADAGASQILSVHLSAEVSGTFESAQMAARSSGVPVHCVDSRQVGMGTGFALLGAADLLADGAPVEKAIAAAKTRGDSTATYFYVDTLEYLRRGGRVSMVGALVGSALAVKPLLTIDDGRIGPLRRYAPRRVRSIGCGSSPSAMPGRAVGPSMSQCSIWPPRSEPATSPTACATSSRSTRYGCSRWAPRSVLTSVPAWSRWSWPRGCSSQRRGSNAARTAAMSSSA